MQTSRTTKLAVLGFLCVFFLHRRWLKYFRRSVENVHPVDDKKVKASIWDDIRHMCRIAVPHLLHSREAGGSLLFLTLFLIKAILNVVRSRADGRVIDALFAGNIHGSPNGESASTALVHLSTIALLCAAVKGSTEHLRFFLIASYRNILTQYFQQTIFSKVGVLPRMCF